VSSHDVEIGAVVEKEGDFHLGKRRCTNSPISVEGRMLNVDESSSWPMMIDRGVFVLREDRSEERTGASKT
jgi:hypothetical protein